MEQLSVKSLALLNTFKPTFAEFDAFANKKKTFYDKVVYAFERGKKVHKNYQTEKSIIALKKNIQTELDEYFDTRKKLMMSVYGSGTKNYSEAIESTKGLYTLPDDRFSEQKKSSLRPKYALFN